MPAPRDRPATDARPPQFAVSCVVTTFAPTGELLDNLRAVIGQVDDVVVVDDGTGPDADDVLAAAEALGARILRLPENVGIAAALNAGVEAVLGVAAAAPDGVLFLDQDSHVGADFVRTLVSAHVAAVRAGMPVAATAPQFFAGVSQTRGERHGHVIARHPIQSGLLVASTALWELGGFRDDLFIDLVDTEFAMRAESHGWVMVAASGLDLPHSLGRQVGLSVFGRMLRTRAGAVAGFTVSTPFRYYYRARNRIAVNRAYRRTRPFAVARATLLELRHYVIAWLAVRDRRALVGILRAGRADGRRGRMGRIPDDIARAAAEISWRVPL